jgi:cellulose synthase/poly-beta-1,6-N-acetylglucosamine synthase-like glycosyltransferase
MKTQKIIYYITTGLFSLLMLFSASMYFLKHEHISETFTSLGFPTFIIYPLAIAKLLGLTAIWGNYSKLLKEWAYAGFVFNTLLAFFAHLMAGDGEQWGAMFAFILIVLSRVYWGKLKTE